ncbi:VWA domain-containing protein [Paraflavitalea sp. CAU 1676]|uniref:VWA domain-containing protein n=1 Tax=Paraflavitalea sp. CAU 1676 TaxID=3032598 RepID=UPI0023DA6E34|nr:VWA domain-containing protein [Paraflavitalea sp. CAU 1676]MDF2187591.1 VWA domain-containing protein [Paraflavitalea sp. CAU 1676]
MNKLALLAIAICFTLNLSGQAKKVNGQLSTSDTADLTILNIYPDAFPNISVVFRAETRTGEPVWNLSKEKMFVKENRQECNVVSLEPISKNQPINVGIVIDHSGSMNDDLSLLYDKEGKALFQIDANWNVKFPKGYKAPIENAKAAVKQFVRSFNTKKDFISITGFSSTVDAKLPLTQDATRINSLVDSMQADSSTALYDAINYSVEEVKKANGLKVVVVLTDGRDNISTSTSKTVIENAIRQEIPIYIIGLGDVNKDTLELIARSTHGQFYFTQSSASLDTVYTQISKQIQAFYNLVYYSSNLSSADSVRQIEITFNVDSLKLFTKPGTLNLPGEVIAYIKKKETQRNYLLFGGIAVLVLIAAGTLLFYHQKNKKNRPVIHKLYPNPSDGNLNIEISGGDATLKIANMNGQILKTFDITGNAQHIDVIDLPNGDYVATVFSNGWQSKGIRFIIKH